MTENKEQKQFALAKSFWPRNNKQTALILFCEELSLHLKFLI